MASFTLNFEELLGLEFTIHQLLLLIVTSWLEEQVKKFYSRIFSFFGPQKGLIV